MHESQITSKEEDQLNAITNNIAKMIDQFLEVLIYSSLENIVTHQEQFKKLDESLSQPLLSQITDANLKSTLENLKKLIANTNSVFQMILKSTDPIIKLNQEISISWKRMWIQDKIMYSIIKEIDEILDKEIKSSQLKENFINLKIIIHLYFLDEVIFSTDMAYDIMAKKIEKITHLIIENVEKKKFFKTEIKSYFDMVRQIPSLLSHINQLRNYIDKISNKYSKEINKKTINAYKEIYEYINAPAIMVNDLLSTEEQKEYKNLLEILTNFLRQHNSNLPKCTFNELIKLLSKDQNDQVIKKCEAIIDQSLDKDDPEILYVMALKAAAITRMAKKYMKDDGRTNYYNDKFFEQVNNFNNYNQIFIRKLLQISEKNNDLGPYYDSINTDIKSICYIVIYISTFSTQKNHFTLLNICIDMLEKLINNESIKQHINDIAKKQKILFFFKDFAQIYLKIAENLLSKPLLEKEQKTQEKKSKQVMNALIKEDENKKLELKQKKCQRNYRKAINQASQFEITNISEQATKPLTNTNSHPNQEDSLQKIAFDNEQFNKGKIAYEKHDFKSSNIIFTNIIKLKKSSLLEKCYAYIFLFETLSLELFSLHPTNQFECKQWRIKLNEMNKHLYEVELLLPLINGTISGDDKKLSLLLSLEQEQLLKLQNKLGYIKRTIPIRIIDTQNDRYPEYLIKDKRYKLITRKIINYYNDNNLQSLLNLLGLTNDNFKKWPIYLIQFWLFVINKKMMSLDCLLYADTFNVGKKSVENFMEEFFYHILELGINSPKSFQRFNLFVQLLSTIKICGLKYKFNSKIEKTIIPAVQTSLKDVTKIWLDYLVVLLTHSKPYILKNNNLLNQLIKLSNQWFKDDIFEDFLHKSYLFEHFICICSILTSYRPSCYSLKKQTLLYSNMKLLFEKLSTLSMINIIQFCHYSSLSELEKEELINKSQERIIKDDNFLKDCSIGIFIALIGILSKLTLNHDQLDSKIIEVFQFRYSNLTERQLEAIHKQFIIFLSEDALRKINELIERNKPQNQEQINEATIENPDDSVSESTLESTDDVYCEKDASLAKNEYYSSLTFFTAIPTKRPRSNSAPATLCFNKQLTTRYSLSDNYSQHTPPYYLRNPRWKVPREAYEWQPPYEYEEVHTLAPLQNSTQDNEKEDSGKCNQKNTI